MATTNEQPGAKEKAWTNEEIEQLKELYPYQKNEDVAAALNKTVRSIRGKANKLKLKKNEGRWSKKEKIALLKNYETLSVLELEAMFLAKFKTTRTKWAIISKYRQLTGKGHPPAASDIQVIV